MASNLHTATAEDFDFALELQRKEIEEAGDNTDEESSPTNDQFRNAWLEELRTAREAHEHQVSLAIAQADEDDRGLLVNALEEEQQAARDRYIASRIPEDASSSGSPTHNRWQHLGGSDIGKEDERDSETSEPVDLSWSAVARSQGNALSEFTRVRKRTELTDEEPSAKRARLIQLTVPETCVCCEDFPPDYYPECSHAHCLDCIAQLRSDGDPRCVLCDLPLENFRPVIIDDFEEDYGVASELITFYEHPEPLDLPEKECIACNDSFAIGSEDIVVLKCNHVYCKDCLLRFIESKIHDQAAFPPRCCYEQPEITDLLTNVWATNSDLSRRWASKITEYLTPNTMSCSNLVCGSLIPTNRVIAGVAYCGACGVNTCAICKEQAHQDGCPQDPDFAALTEMAKNGAWKHCIDCRQLVEKNGGCNHMTCRCGSQWCYVCKARWQTCHCPLFTEESLMETIPPPEPDVPAPEAIQLRSKVKAPARRKKNQQPPVPVTRETCRHDSDWQAVPGLFVGDNAEAHAKLCETCDRQYFSQTQCSLCEIVLCEECCDQARPKTIRGSVNRTAMGRYRYNREDCEHGRWQQLSAIGNTICGGCRAESWWHHECTDCGIAMCQACRERPGTS